MFTKLFSSLLIVALPISALASSHGSHLVNRHHELAKRAETNQTLSKRISGSKWSFYDVETGNAGSCGTKHTNNDFTVAMNQAQMNSGLCYKRITMSYGGKSTSADISDTCPGCPYGGLDLSPALFNFFASPDAGIIYGEWEFGDAAPAPAPPPPPPPPTPTPPPPPPPPTTTSSSSRYTPPPPSTTSSVQPSSSSAAASSSSAASSSINYSSGAASGLAIPTGTAGSTAPANLAELNQAFIQIGGIAVAGHGI